MVAAEFVILSTRESHRGMQLFNGEFAWVRNSSAESRPDDVTAPRLTLFPPKQGLVGLHPLIPQLDLRAKIEKRAVNTTASFLCVALKFHELPIQLFHLSRLGRCRGVVDNGSDNLLQPFLHAVANPLLLKDSHVSLQS